MMFPWYDITMYSFHYDCTRLTRLLNNTGGNNFLLSENGNCVVNLVCCFQLIYLHDDHVIYLVIHPC